MTSLPLNPSSLFSLLHLRSRTAARAALTLVLAAALMLGALPAGAQSAPEIDPALRAQLASAAVTDELEVIVSFEGDKVTPQQLASVQAVGVRGVYMTHLPILGVVATPAQVNQLAALPGVRSLWSNAALSYENNGATAATGAQRVWSDAGLAARNGGLPVTGKGVRVLVNDSGIDALHGDLPFGTKVVQNVTAQTNIRAVLTGTLVPSTYIENTPMSDYAAGHGTHVAGTVAGSGAQSGGKYAGVAPGAQLVGYGSGVGINILDSVNGFNYAIAKRETYRIRVITNSFGSTGDVGTDFNPNHPTNIASRIANESGIVVVFSAGNSGPAAGTITGNFKKAPWVVMVANATKSGLLHSSSSRGRPGVGGTVVINGKTFTWEDRPTVAAPGTNIISVRSSTNTNSAASSNGPDDDIAMIEPEYVPYYTVLSGTSMAAPHVAGVIALMLEANPNLTTAEVKQILQETTTNIPGREPWEVGAGMVNALAAVDRAMAARAYGSTVNMKRTFHSQASISVHSQPYQIDYNPVPEASPTQNQHRFTVPAGVAEMEVTAVARGVLDTTGNTMNLVLIAPDGREYSSGVPTTGWPTSHRRTIAVSLPEAGEWTVELRGLRGTTDNPTDGAALPDDRVPGEVKLIVPLSGSGMNDVPGHALAPVIQVAVAKRLVDGFSDSTFRPDRHLKRSELADYLTMGTLTRQYLPTDLSTTYGDVSGAHATLLAESATARGAAFLDRFYQFRGVMLAKSTGEFAPSDAVNRAQLAYSFVQALGLEPQALAHSGPVTYEYKGQRLPVLDAAQIPAGLAGYVQLALDQGMLEATVSADGTSAVFKPLKTVSRADYAKAAVEFFARFLGGF